MYVRCEENSSHNNNDWSIQVIAYFHFSQQTSAVLDTGDFACADTFWWWYVYYVCNSTLSCCPLFWHENQYSMHSMRLILYVHSCRARNERGRFDRPSGNQFTIFSTRNKVSPQPKTLERMLEQFNLRWSSAPHFILSTSIRSNCESQWYYVEKSKQINATEEKRMMGKHTISSF